jgi:hypothetical protein
MGPIFVRGLSRSGGTLMCTLLDCHKDVAMCYEQYPNLLEIDNSVNEFEFIEKIINSSNMIEARKQCPTEKFGIYLIRYERGGFNHKDFAKHWRQIIEENLTLKSAEGRFRMMEICGIEKMRRFKKFCWGMKFLGNYENFLQRWDGAIFINVLRDGRDVMASQLATLKGERTPESIAKGWVKTHERFAQFMKKYPKKAYLIRYENLVKKPEYELKKLCHFIDLEFDRSMLNHYQSKLTIFQANHISGPRIKSPIDDSKIGRWKNDLSKNQLDRFLSIAENSLINYGYEH